MKGWPTGRAKSLHPNNLVVQKSSVPAGPVTGEFHNPDMGVHCPEDSGTPIVLNPGMEPELVRILRTTTSLPCNEKRSRSQGQGH